MQNIHNNRISAALTDQDMQDMMNALDTFERVLPFLIELTNEEVQTMPKIDVSNHNFVTETLNVMEMEQIPLPSTISKEEIKKDLELYDRLNRMLLRLEQLTKGVKHTAMLAGSEAYTCSLFVYKIIQTFAQSGMTGYSALNERLKSRFAGQGRTSKEDSQDSTENTNGQTPPPTV
jgi:hypothetical protein